MKLAEKYRGVVLLTLLVAGLPGLAVRFALRDTFRCWRDCLRLADRIAAMPAQEAADGSEIGFADAPELILSGGVLDSVRRAAAEHGVWVTGYEPLVTLQWDGAALHTAQVTLTGGFAGLLRTTESLERRLACCWLRSAAWRSVVQYRTRKTQLVLTLYVQQLTLKP